MTRPLSRFWRLWEMPDLFPMDGEQIWEDWILLPERLMIHTPSKTALVSDLHLGYALARNDRGDSLPEIPLNEELAPLWRAMDRHGIREIACGGDLFEKGGNTDLENQLLSLTTTKGFEWVAIAKGNHDRKGGRNPSTLPWHDFGFPLGNWWITHGDRPLPKDKNLILGHRHPVVSLPGGNRHPCFLLSENRVILPAYSMEVAGVSILKEFQGPEWECVAIGSRGCVSLGTMDQVRRLAFQQNKQKRDRKSGPA